MNFIKMIVALVVILAIVAMFKSCGTAGACQERGVSYYKEIGSYPRLSTGESADEKIKGMCGRNANAF